MNDKKVFKQLGNGAWIAVEDPSALFDMIVQTPQYNAASGSLGRITREEIVSRLKAGATLKYALDWYANVRITRPASADRRPVIRVDCDCGHECSEKLVVMTSRGTSCPDCYDRMSES